MSYERAMDPAGIDREQFAAYLRWRERNESREKVAILSFAEWIKEYNWCQETGQTTS